MHQRIIGDKPVGWVPCILMQGALCESPQKPPERKDMGKSLVKIPERKKWGESVKMVRKKRHYEGTRNRDMGRKIIVAVVFE